MRLPFADTEISFSDFLHIGPLVLVGIGVYLHLFIGYWKSLKGPAEVSVGLPYVFNMPIVAARWFSIFVFYCLIPLVLAVFSFKSTGHDGAWIAALTFMVILGSIWLGVRRSAEQRVNWSLRLIRIALVLSFGWGLALIFQGSNPFRCLVNLAGAELSGADLAEVDLSCINLQAADLSGSNLRGANLTEAKLEEANLRNADLEGAILTSAKLTQAVLAEANLQNVDLSQATLDRANLTNSNLEGADVEPSQLRAAVHWDKAFYEKELLKKLGLPEDHNYKRIPKEPQPEPKPSPPRDEEAQAVEPAPLRRVTKAAEKSPTVKPHQKEGLKYVWIPPGKFQMGCVKGDDACDEDETPSHSVEITKEFWLARTEVTVTAYRLFAQETEQTLTYHSFPNFNRWGRDEDHPMVLVTWGKADAYCKWAGGRLPTEAEWEYAARGGTEGLTYPKGNEINNNDAQFDTDGTAPVTNYSQNAFGLYNMVGNVWEWCADRYGEDYYSSEHPGRDPKGPSEGKERVLRGGSWANLPVDLRTSSRGQYDPDHAHASIGFRCARDDSP